MELLIAFVVALLSRLFVAKYWKSFLIGLLVFEIIHFITAASKPGELNINQYSVSNETGRGLGMFLIPFLIACVAAYFIKMLDPKKEDPDTKTD